MIRASRPSLLALSLLAALVVAGCQREQPQPVATPVDTPPAAQPEQPAIVLEDVIERDPRYLVGITYPPLASKYPGLARELQQYTDAARADLQQALAGVEEHAGEGMLYDLSLEFREVLDSERFAAIAAAGSLYTGGAHGMPLVGRWVWLPQHDALLSAEALIPRDEDWADIAAYARQQLHAALEQRVEADGLAPEERAEVLRGAGRMIDAGTAPEAENFDQFEPVVDPDGRLMALRFVFPPYQVGPYSDGEHSVEVPAAVLLPKVAPQYRELFSGG